MVSSHHQSIFVEAFPCFDSSSWKHASFAYAWQAAGTHYRHALLQKYFSVHKAARISAHVRMITSRIKCTYQAAMCE